jgi:hypothetical protein
LRRPGDAGNRCASPIAISTVLDLREVGDDVPLAAVEETFDRGALRFQAKADAPCLAVETR